ncbi:MAG: hypothetical protein R6X03_04770 [Methyloceanibacter sp.]
MAATKRFRETIETANQWTRGRQGRAKSHGSGHGRVTLRFNPERGGSQLAGSRKDRAPGGAIPRIRHGKDARAAVALVGIFRAFTKR